MSLAEFNAAAPGSPSATQAIDNLPKTPRREQQGPELQLAELAGLKNKISNMDTNTRVGATHRVWTIGLASAFPEVKMRALELLEEPAGSASDHIRMPAVYAIAEIANSTEEVQVKLLDLAKLREPLQASQVPIRDVAIDAVILSPGRGNREKSPWLPSRNWRPPSIAETTA